MSRISDLKIKIEIIHFASGVKCRISSGDFELGLSSLFDYGDINSAIESSIADLIRTILGDKSASNEYAKLPIPLEEIRQNFIFKNELQARMREINKRNEQDI